MPQQIPWRIFHLELTQEMAGIVIRDFVGEMNAKIFDAHHVHKKIGKLIGLACDVMQQFVQTRIVKNFGIEHLHHAGAGARRRDDVLRVAKDFQKPLREFNCFGMVAGVEGWLATTRLLGGIIYFGAGLFQNLVDVDPNLREELVGQARDEQGDFH